MGEAYEREGEHLGVQACDHGDGHALEEGVPDVLPVERVLDVLQR